MDPMSYQAHLYLRMRLLQQMSQAPQREEFSRWPSRSEALGKGTPCAVASMLTEEV